MSTFRELTYQEIDRLADAVVDRLRRLRRLRRLPQVQGRDARLDAHGRPDGQVKPRYDGWHGKEDGNEDVHLPGPRAPRPRP